MATIINSIINSYSWAKETVQDQIRKIQPNRSLISKLAVATIFSYAMASSLFVEASEKELTSHSMVQAPSNNSMPILHTFATQLLAAAGWYAEDWLFPIEEGNEPNRTFGSADEAAATFLQHQRKTGLKEQRKYVLSQGLVSKKEQAYLNKTLCLPKMVFWKRARDLETMALNAMAIRKIYQKTHYVALHGMPIGEYVFLCFLKELIKTTSEDTSKFKHFKFLRVPNMADQGTIEMVKSESLVYKEGFDELPENKTRLLSCVCNFSDIAYQESALYFALLNVSSSGDSVLTEDNTRPIYQPSQIALRQLLKSYYPTVKGKEWNEFWTKIRNVAHLIPKETSCGSLVTVCVPKKNHEEFMYRSHPYGIMCRCETSLDDDSHILTDREILDQLQQEETSHVQCSQIETLPPKWIPQYRVFLPQVKPENGCRVFCFTPLDRSVRKAIKAGCKEILSQMPKPII